MKLCDTCIYRNNVEQLKPCIIYRDDCEYYEKKRGDMTREEELDWLYRLRSEIYVYMPKEWLIPMNDALDMAIKALEQEPCGDSISRQAAIDITWEEPSYTDALNVLTEVRDKVKSLPPVNPQEPKMGHWKKIQSGDKDFPESIVCSRCGHENSYLDFGISSVPIGKSFKKSKYCPNCGAKMQEVEE